MIITKKLNKSGSTFIVVIGILAIIIFAATMFMSSTVQEGRQTSMSIRGLQANSLAEAAIERAMNKIAKEINKLDLKAQDADKQLAFTIRLPAQEGSSTLSSYENQKANLGDDKELALGDAVKKEIEFDKDKLKEGNTDDLKELVEYMTDKSYKDYKVTVKAKIVCAFRNSPGSEKPDYKIPGVDISWNTRRNVETLLNGDGFSAFKFEFPKNMKWFSFSFDIFGGLISFDLTEIISKILEKLGLTNPTLVDMTTLDWVADKVLNDIIGGITKAITGKDASKIYPIEIMIAQGDMPTTVQALWPSSLQNSVTESEGQYLEKYGQISFDSEASIQYNDGYTSTRRINAVKDFKVADCEPPAPMYSLFIANEKNEQIVFDNVGGQFYVNNITYTNMSENIKKILRGETQATEEEMNKKEFPGLIRVNAKCDKSITCNIGFLGQTLIGSNKSEISLVNKTDDGNIIQESTTGLAGIGEKGRQYINGVEIPLLLKTKGSVKKYNKSHDVQIEKKEKKPSEASVNTDEKDSGLDEKNDIDELKKDTEKLNLGTLEAGLFKKIDLGINITPSITKMGCSVIELAICLAVMPLAEKANDAINNTLDDSGFGQYVSTAGDNIVDKMDCFETWEMPYMGSKNELYTWPDLGRDYNKTHLFGYSGFHPTLTREIEGNVVSQYRQWRMCIVGLGLDDKIYIGPVPIPPIPVPIWKSTTQSLKYGYNIGGFMALDDDGKKDKTVHTYDPAEPQNMAPNLYTSEQYAKKSTYYYPDYTKFIEDIPNRLATVKGKRALVLNGITYIAGSLGKSGEDFSPKQVNDEELKKLDTLYVVGKGMIVISGNLYLGCNIVNIDDPDKPEDPTVFSLICRKGGLMVLNSNNYLIEGSLYTDQGIYIIPNASLHILGNWVTNRFQKTKMGGHIILDYKSTRTRTSIGSLHPTRGKYNPLRYNVSFSPIWSTWRAY